MSDRKRRIYGFMIGLSFGLLYAYISQYINVWMLPGIPLYELPIGRVASVILTSVFMGILGALVAWDEESFWGLIVGAFFTVLISSLQAYINLGSSQGAATFLLFLFTFLPRLVVYLPLAFFLRWASNSFDNSIPDTSSRLSRPFKATLAILALALIAGSFSMLSSDAKQALKDANALVLEGMSANANGTALPKPLLHADGFSTYAKGAYTLEWSNNANSLPIIRPEANEDVIESLIIFRFENNYKFGCVYTPPSHVPNCINITLVR